MTRARRVLRVAALGLGTLGLGGACSTPGLSPVELETEPQEENQLQLTAFKDVDVLFVIDNSGSMGEEQANLAMNFGAFIEVLEAYDVEANYRVGVTTTDNGNPWCPTGVTTPEGGKLVMSSCRSRIQDFVFEGVGEPLDARDLACNDICALDDEQLQLLPTTTDVDPNPAPRPWLENIEGSVNVPAGVSTVEAFRCFGPQGINGCGFESPLESMYLALVRAESPEEASYGFLRQSALLAVVFVTDELDCSYAKQWSEIFEADGNKAFWGDPNENFPTSALCWNAGVECVGDPTLYDDCVAANYDVNGLPASDDEAVLQPLSRYYQFLDALENEKRIYNPDNELIVGLIGGVQPDGSLVYAEVDDTDPEFALNFGIGPGCTGPLGEAAVPPVRLRELTDNYTPDNLHSICSTDYTGALERIADEVRDEIIPACYYRCAADTDPETELIDAVCEVEQTLPDGQTRELQECQRDAAGAYAFDPSSNAYVMPSTEARACYVVRTDPGTLSEDPRDDIAPYCVDSGANLELKIAYAPGFPEPAGTQTRASCVVSDQPEQDCPGLG